VSMKRKITWEEYSQLPPSEQKKFRRVPFDTRFKVWYGDDDYQRRLIETAEKLDTNGIVIITTLYAYHYGGQSYQYLDKKVQRRIAQDRKSFTRKYGRVQP